MVETKARYIPTLDGWRAVAVLLVIGGHASRLLRQPDSYIGNLLAGFLSHAGFGVDVFFAISGYLIITLLLREKDKATDGRIDLVAFYRRRAFRILPPILVYVIVLLAISATGLIYVGAREVTAVLLFFRNYAAGGWYTGHFWSLAVEEHFYLFAPLIIAFSVRQRALVITLSAALACIVVRYLEWRYLDGTKVEFRTESRLDGLMFGAAMALLMHAERSRAWLLRHLDGRTAAALLALATVLLVVFPQMPARRTVVAVAMPLLLAFTVLRPETTVGRLLELSWLRFVGRLSYSLYIWQMLFFVPIVDIPLVQDLPGALIATAVCSVASYYLVEQPSIALGRSLSIRRKAKKGSVQRSELLQSD